jgi:phosphoglucomutase
VGQGYVVPFGYEEAIGFMFGSEIRDKDGVAATVSLRIVWLPRLTTYQVSFVSLVLELRNQGMSVAGFLQDLYQTYVSYTSSY